MIPLLGAFHSRDEWDAAHAAESAGEDGPAILSPNSRLGRLARRRSAGELVDPAASRLLGDPAGQPTTVYNTAEDLSLGAVPETDTVPGQPFVSHVSPKISMARPDDMLGPPDLEIGSPPPANPTLLRKGSVCLDPNSAFTYEMSMLVQAKQEAIKTVKKARQSARQLQEEQSAVRTGPDGTPDAAPARPTPTMPRSHDMSVFRGDLLDLENESVKKMETLASVVLVCYVLTGIGFYSIVAEWPIIDSVYFTIVTVTTVGYGDLVPQTHPQLVFTIFFMLLGVGFVGGMLGVLINVVLDREEALVNKMHDRMLNYSQESDTPHNNCEDWNRRQYEHLRRHLVFSVFNVLLVVGIGSSFFCVFEDMPWSAAVYFATATVTTVGYGDVVCTKLETKLFVVVYMIVGTLSVARAMGDIAAFPIQIRRTAHERQVLNQFDGIFSVQDLMELASTADNMLADIRSGHDPTKSGRPSYGAPPSSGPKFSRSMSEPVSQASSTQLSSSRSEGDFLVVGSPDSHSDVYLNNQSGNEPSEMEPGSPTGADGGATEGAGSHVRRKTAKKSRRKARRKTSSPLGDALTRSLSGVNLNHASCTPEQFTLAMLVKLQKITLDDIHACTVQFQKLDRTGTGELSQEDVLVSTAINDFREKMASFRLQMQDSYADETESDGSMDRDISNFSRTDIDFC